LDLCSCKEDNTNIKQEKGRRVAAREPKGIIGSSKATTKATTTTVATSDLNLNETTTKAAMTIAKRQPPCVSSTLGNAQIAVKITLVIVTRDMEPKKILGKAKNLPLFLCS